MNKQQPYFDQKQTGETDNNPKCLSLLSNYYCQRNCKQNRMLDCDQREQWISNEILNDTAFSIQKKKSKKQKTKNHKHTKS